MTQILTFVSSAFCAQVSDRLVVTTGRIRENFADYQNFDKVANKVLIYAARDAFVCIGYAGLAFLENQPTDDWLATVLQGKQPGRQLHGFGALSAGGRNRSDIGLAIRRIQKQLERVARTLSTREAAVPLKICVGGWQWNRGFLRPIVVELEKSAKQAIISLSQLPRYWHWDRPFTIIDTGGWVLGHPDYEGFLRQRLQEAAPLLERPEAVVNALADTVQYIAERGDAPVGGNLMSVLLPSSGTAPVEVRFLPKDRHTAALQSSGGSRRELEVAYTPWIIGPSIYFAPSVISGTFDAYVGQIRITLHAPESSITMFSSQRRPAPP